jgi:type IV secretory pathway VirB4 component
MKVDEIKFNPFDRTDTPDNRERILNWLILVARVKNEERQLKRDLIDLIDSAYELLDKGQRSLESIFAADIVQKNTETYNRLYEWADPSTKKGGLFNAKFDGVGEFSGDLTTFEMAEIYADSDLAEAIIAHVTSRIEESLINNDERGCIFIDEASKILSNSHAQKWYEDILRRFRKLGVAVGAANQDAEALFNSGLEPVLRVNVPTIFFVGPQSASPSLIKSRELTDREQHFLRNGWGLRRPILMIRSDSADSPRESVILDGNLGILRDARIEGHKADLLRMLQSDPDSKRKWQDALSPMKDKVSYPGYTLYDAVIAYITR